MIDKSQTDMPFDPSKCRKAGAFKGKPLSKPLNVTVIQNGSQRVRMASIPKENLSFDTFQRPHESHRSDRIRSKFHKDFGVVNISEVELNGLYYYTVTDGQHRAFANPENCVLGVVTNGMTPAKAFLLGNDNSKKLGDDDKLWARHESGEHDVIWFFTCLKKYGLKPHRLSGDEGKKNIKVGKFVGTAKLWQVYDKVKVSVSKEDPKMASDEALTLSRSRFKQLCDIMIDTYGLESFSPDPDDKISRSRRKSAYRDVWIAMLDFMVEYDWPLSDLISEQLRKGAYRKNNSGPVCGERYLTLERVIQLSKEKYADIIAMGSERNRQTAITNIIRDIYKASQTCKF